MKIQWTSKALGDLSRLYAFLAPSNQKAAAKTVQLLAVAPQEIIEQPRIGEQLDGFEGREVRRLLIGRYEIRYELTSQMVYILRIWHTREAR